MRWGWRAPMASNVMWDSDAATAIFERQARIVREAGALAELPVFLSSRWRSKGVDRRLGGAEALDRRERQRRGGDREPAPAVRRDSGFCRSQGREAEASALIEATIAMAEAVGAGLAVRVAQWAAAVLYNGLGRYAEAASRGPPGDGQRHRSVSVDVGAARARRGGGTDR